VAEDEFPVRPVGTMSLDRNVDNFHNESDQAAFGTGVLVDSLDFSDDKMLVGRTLRDATGACSARIWRRA